MKKLKTVSNLGFVPKRIHQYAQELLFMFVLHVTRTKAPNQLQKLFASFQNKCFSQILQQFTPTKL